MVYDRWDALTKQAHRDVRDWVPHVDLARDALAACYRELGLSAGAGEDISALFATLPLWPLWPDVEHGCPGSRRTTGSVSYPTWTTRCSPARGPRRLSTPCC